MLFSNKKCLGLIKKKTFFFSRSSINERWWLFAKLFAHKLLKYFLIRWVELQRIFHFKTKCLKMKEFVNDVDDVEWIIFRYLFNGFIHKWCLWPENEKWLSIKHWNGEFHQHLVLIYDRGQINEVTIIQTQKFIHFRMSQAFNRYWNLSTNQILLQLISIFELWNSIR